MQHFWALEAPPPDPRASGGWGFCPQTPSFWRLGASPPDPHWPPAAGGSVPRPLKQPPHCEFLATRLLSENLGFSSICFEMPAQISWRFSFWSLVKSFETTCAQTFVICRFSCTTCHIVSLSMDILSAISRIISRRSSRTIFSISRLLFVVFDKVGRRQRSSSSTSVRPSWNLLCHSKTLVLDMHYLP